MINMENNRFELSDKTSVIAVHGTGKKPGYVSFVKLGHNNNKERKVHLSLKVFQQLMSNSQEIRSALTSAADEIPSDIELGKTHLMQVTRFDRNNQLYVGILKRKAGTTDEFDFTKSLNLNITEYLELCDHSEDINSIISSVGSQSSVSKEKRKETSDGHDYSKQKKKHKADNDGESEHIIAYKWYIGDKSSAVVYLRQADCEAAMEKMKMTLAAVAAEGDCCEVRQLLLPRPSKLHLLQYLLSREALELIRLQSMSDCEACILNVQDRSLHSPHCTGEVTAEKIAQSVASMDARYVLPMFRQLLVLLCYQRVDFVAELYDMFMYFDGKSRIIQAAMSNEIHSYTDAMCQLLNNCLSMIKKC